MRKPAFTIHVFTVERWSQPNGDDWDFETIYLVLTDSEIFEMPCGSPAQLQSVYARFGLHTLHTCRIQVKRNKLVKWPEGLNYIRQHRADLYNRVKNYLRVLETTVEDS